MTAKLGSGRPVLVDAEESETWGPSAVNTFRNTLYGIWRSFGTKSP